MWKLFLMLFSAVALSASALDMAAACGGGGGCGMSGGGGYYRGERAVASRKVLAGGANLAQSRTTPVAPGLVHRARPHEAASKVQRAVPTSTPIAGAAKTTVQPVARKHR
ncbi:MAG TPA: hypothetical protein VFW73_08900 [Lacipirellulaceae bacterium]|nr:hypothetical protein [Lacipirellulaceae bacterium]